MSDLQRSFAKAKLAGLPLIPPLPANALRDEPVHEDEAQDEDTWSASSASSASSTGTIKPNSKLFFARPDGFVHSPTLLRLTLYFVPCPTPCHHSLSSLPDFSWIGLLSYQYF